MCDLNNEGPKVSKSLTAPPRIDCRACGRCLRMNSQDESGKPGNPGHPNSTGTESQGMVTISRCPRQAV
jgi:hypothetical protein